MPEGRVDSFVDPEKIIQVLTNLVNNAYKFTNKGSIEVSVSADHSCIRCSVKDTGIGIATQDLPRLFSKFEQLGRQEGAGAKGTGLGLSIAKGIVEAHEGQIMVESQIGAGTQFIVTLPKLDVIQESARYLIARLKENAEKYNHYSVLVISIKNYDVKLSGKLDMLESVIKKQLYRQIDQTVKHKESIYVILPDTTKENTVIVVNRIRQIVHSKECEEQLRGCDGLIYQIMSFPDGALTEEALTVDLGKTREEFTI